MGAVGATMIVIDGVGAVQIGAGRRAVRVTIPCSTGIVRCHEAASNAVSHSVP